MAPGFRLLRLTLKRRSLTYLFHYQAWVKEGYLKTTMGNMIDYEQLTQDTIFDISQYDIRQIGFDKTYAAQYSQEVGKRCSVEMVEVPQRVQFLSPPMKALEALIADGRIHHDGNPAMTWMMGNLVAHPDANDNVFPRKTRDESKIDGPVAAIMALSLVMAMQEKSLRYSSLWSHN